MKESDSLRVTDNGGIYGFRGEFTLTSRELFLRAFKNAGIDMQAARELWPNTVIKSTSAEIRGVLKPIAARPATEGETGMAHMDFHPRACETIFSFIETEAAEGGS